jgi:hypothetical protein
VPNTRTPAFLTYQLNTNKGKGVKVNTNGGDFGNNKRDSSQRPSEVLLQLGAMRLPPFPQKPPEELLQSQEDPAPLTSTKNEIPYIFSSGNPEAEFVHSIYETLTSVRNRVRTFMLMVTVAGYFSTLYQLLNRIIYDL